MADSFSEFDFLPICIRDEVGGVDHVGGFMLDYGLLAHRFSHAVMGAGIDHVLGGVDQGFVFFGEFFSISSRDGDDGHVYGLHFVTLFVQGGF